MKTKFLKIKQKNEKFGVHLLSYKSHNVLDPHVNSWISGTLNMQQIKAFIHVRAFNIDKQVTKRNATLETWEEGGNGGADHRN